MIHQSLSRVRCAATILARFALTSLAADSITLIPFAIKDQFDRIRTAAELQGKVMLVFGSDRRDGSQKIETLL